MYNDDITKSISQAVSEVLEKNKSSEVKEATDFASSSQEAKKTYQALEILAQTLKKGSKLNKTVNKDLGGKYDSDFAKMSNSLNKIIEILDEIDSGYQGNE